MAYNYREEMENDIREWIIENVDYLELDLEDRDEVYEKIEEELWVADNVTGNASGSYTFNRAKAKEYVEDNYKLVIEALREFGYDLNHLDEKLRDEEWEYLDVTIRCYLLGSVLNGILDELIEELEEMRNG